MTFTLQSAGTTYRISTQTGSAIAARDANLGEHDPRNPSAIAHAAGTLLGQLIPSVLDGFCTTLCANVFVLGLMWHLRAEGAQPIAIYLLLPIVIRAFGALAVMFGTGAARTMEALNPAVALVRAELVYLVVAVGAVVGTCTWLVPDHVIRVVACAVLGLLMPVTLGHLHNFVVSRRGQSANSNRIADNPLGEGLAAGMLWLTVPALTLLFLLTIVSWLGSTMGHGDGYWLALASCYLGMTMSLPYYVTVASVQPLLSLARRSGLLIDSLRVENGQRRLARVQESARPALSCAVTAQSQACIGLPLLAALMMGTLSKGSGIRIAGAEALSALCVCPIAVVAPLAPLVRSSLQAAQATAKEVHRQIAGFTQEAGLFRVPANFTPSYRSCVEVASRESNRRVFGSNLAFASIPIAYCALLHLITRDANLFGQGMALYLGLIAIATCIIGFGLEIADALASAARTRTLRGGLWQPLATDSVLHHLALHTTTSIRTVAKATALIALTLSPYVF